MNVIVLTGNATKPIEIRYNQKGTPIGNGTIAVRRDFKNQQGEYETDFFNFVAIGKVSEIMANNINKGDKFGIRGRLQNRVWDSDNGKKYFTEVVVEGFDFPSKTNNAPDPNKGYEGLSKESQNDPFANDGQINVSEDDLPF